MDGARLTAEKVGRQGGICRVGWWLDLLAGVRSNGGMGKLRAGVWGRLIVPFLLFVVGVFLGGGCLVAPPFFDKDPVCPGPDDVAAPFPADLAPEATAAAGRLEGRFSVTNAGDARYVVPIDVPPGRAGV